MKSLIDAGHQVTIVTPFPNQAATENYTSIIDSSKDEFIYVGQSSFQDFAKLTTYEMIKIIHDMEKSHCNKVLKLPEIRVIKPQYVFILSYPRVGAIYFFTCTGYI